MRILGRSLATLAIFVVTACGGGGSSTPDAMVSSPDAGMCPAGFDDPNGDGSLCVDQDECMGDGAGNNCDPAAICTNNDGGFTCACPTGFTDPNGDGTSCVNIDECTDGTDTCVASMCVDTVGSFDCVQLALISPYVAILALANPNELENANFDDAFSSDACDGGAIVVQYDLTDDIGSTIQGAQGMAMHPATGEVFIAYKIMGQTDRMLGTINLTDGVITNIGDVGDRISSLTFDGAGNLLATTGQGGRVADTAWLVNQTDGTLTLIIAVPNGSDGSIIGYNPDDGFVYHVSGRDTNDAVDLLDISIDLTDPLVPVITATSTVVVKTGFDYDEAFSMIYGWPTAGAFGVFNLDQELPILTIDSSDPTLPTLDAVDPLWNGSGACGPGPSTSAGVQYIKGAVMVPQVFIQAADATACTASYECEGVCDALDSNTCEPKNTCGNGVVEMAETCDDGNTIDADGCAADCGVVLLADGAGCAQDFECINVCDTLDSSQCEPADTCGNAHVEGTEACDDGNLTDGDGCQADCTLP